MRTQYHETRLLPGLASTLGLLVFGIGFSFGAAQAGAEETPEPEQDTNFSYEAPGLESNDHSLNFLKRPPFCEKDRLMLFWGAGQSTQEFEKVDALVQFNLGDLRYTAPTLALAVPIRFDPEAEETLVFTTPEIDPDLFLYTEERETLRVKIIGPEPLLHFLTSIQQSFDVSGLNADRNRSYAECQKQSQAPGSPLAENNPAF